MNPARKGVPDDQSETDVPLQMTLTLPLPTKMGRASFVASPANAAALALIDRWPHWPSPCAAVFGPQGSGKTHILHIWAEACGAHLTDGRSLTPDIVLGMPPGARSAIDEADLAAGFEPSATALFHLINRAHQDGGRVLMAGVAGPSHWLTALPDLRTRLGAMTAAEIGAPDDALLAGVLAKLFSDRQLRATPALISFIVARIERSVSAADALVAEMDAQTLGTGRTLSFELAERLIADQQRD